MAIIEMRSRVGPDGVLTVKVPLSPSEANREVRITVESLSEASGVRAARQEWKEFIDRTYGSCAGLGLEEPEDLPLPRREALE